MKILSLALLIAAFAVGCAAGGTSDPDASPILPDRSLVGSDGGAIDRSIGSDARPVDSSVGPDARMPDSSVITMPDGAIGGMCTSNNDCPATDCCFGGLACVPGMRTPLPPPFDCIPN